MSGKYALLSSKVGIDLDNTLIDYGPALGNLVSETLGDDEYKGASLTKAKAKELILSRSGNETWTEAQGKLYSSYLKYAIFFPRAIEVLQKLSSLGKQIVIISHKTKFPYKGEQVNLQDAAEVWLNERLPPSLVKIKRGINLFFEESISEKVTRIVNENCDYFIDDLDEVLTLLPSSIVRICFQGSREVDGIFNAKDWEEVQRQFE